MKAQFFYYLGYNALVGVIYIILISLVSFFHFLLDHRLGVIEEWVFDRGHQIVMTSKALALMGMFSFMDLRSQHRHPFRNLISSGVIPNPPREIFIVVTCLFVVAVFFCRPKIETYPDISIYKVGVGLVGSILFYLLDIIFLLSLELRQRCHNKWRPWVFAALFFLLARSVFLFGLKLDVVVFFHMLACLYLAGKMRPNWVLPGIYLALFVAPASALLGMDAIWGDTYSVFKMTGQLGWMEMGTLVGVGLLYLKYKM